MSQPYVGEIRMFGGSFAPNGWAFCNGAIIAISENDTLFNLIGTTYGGDGQETFALPNLSGRVPVHQGQGGGLSNFIIGQTGGVESVTLTTQQIPSHSHPAIADGNPGSTGAPNNAYFAKTGSVTVYTVPNDPNNPDPPNFRNLNPATLITQGGNQPHSNMQPFLVVNYIISLYGIYPSPT